MNKEKQYKEIIKSNLNNTLNYGYIPELGEHKSGKVRDVHFTSDKIGSPIIMVASDRISCFDHILSRKIPFKGYILNQLSTWAFENSKDVIQNATIESPHPNVIVQKFCKNIMVECVVRGYVWGSLAGEYENGKRVLCGEKFEDGLLRYQKLPEPIFTPTTKSEHDEPMTFEEVEKFIGKEKAKKVKEASLALFKRASELADKSGLIFIDTKYEFGFDEKDEMYLIDEANTPDSSRYCSKEEYAKFADIQKEMDTGNYKNVSALLKIKPELKITEMSKQFARDILTSKGFSYGSDGDIPELTDDDVIEISYRYINLYETLTGKDFIFPSGNQKSAMLASLQTAGFIKGGYAVIMAGSDSDRPHIEKLQSELDKYEIKSEVRICSAHKQPTACEEAVKSYNESLEPIVIIGVAGGTDALSGVASFHSIHPVISCPPKATEYTSCIFNPPGSSNSMILRPANVARQVAQIFSSVNKELADKLLSDNQLKIDKLVKADKEF